MPERVGEVDTWESGDRAPGKEEPEERKMAAFQVYKDRGYAWTNTNWKKEDEGRDHLPRLLSRRRADEGIPHEDLYSRAVAIYAQRGGDRGNPTS